METNQNRSAKSAIWFLIIVVMLLVSVIGVMAAGNKSPNSLQTTSEPTNNTEDSTPQYTTQPSYTTPSTSLPSTDYSTPSPDYSSPTTCNPGLTGGLDCTSSNSSGVHDTHCTDNQLGGYTCM